MTESAAPTTQAAFLYSLELPTHVEVLLEEIDVPLNLRSPTYNPRRMLRLPCREVFKGPVPRVSMELLRTLCPADIVSGPSAAPAPALKASAAAKSYRLRETRTAVEPPRHVLEAAPPAGPASPEEPPAGPVTSPVAKADDAPVPQITKAPPTSAVEISQPKVQGEKPVLTAPAEQPIPEPEGELPQPTTRKSFFAGLPIFRKKPAKKEQSDKVEETSTAQPTTQDPPPPVESKPAPAATQSLTPPPTAAPAAKEVVDTLPTEPTADAAPTPTAAIPAKQPTPPPEPVVSEKPVGPAAEPSAPVTDSRPEATPAPARQEMELVPVDAEPTTLACEERLQEIFLTEESLPLDKVMELCGRLPGVRACILTRQSSVVSAHAAPEHLDLVALTANGSRLLENLQDSARQMGLGHVHTITIHSEKSPVSIFSSGSTTLMVTHGDRGFVPGVRERLSQVVAALDGADLPRSLPSPAHD